MLPQERNEFIEKHYGLVHALCNRFRGRGVDYEDLFQAGSIGLIKAADGFDEGRNVLFSTYAVPVILGEIKRIFRDGGTVKVSRNLRELSLKITAFRERYIKEKGEDPTISEIAAALNVTEEEIIESLNAAKPVLSLTASDDENENIDFPVDYRDALFDRIAINEIKENLPSDEWHLLVLRYFRGKTQSETAALLSMTQVQVSRKERSILEKLRKKLA